MRKTHIYLLIAVLFSGFITIISLKESEGLTISFIPFLDKILHLVTYIILTVLWSNYFIHLLPNTKTVKVLTIVVLFLTVYGIVIEVLQSKLTSSRVYDINDIVANLLGIAIGVLIFNYLKKLKLKSNKGLFF